MHPHRSMAASTGKAKMRAMTGKGGGGNPFMGGSRFKALGKSGEVAKYDGHSKAYHDIGKAVGGRAKAKANTFARGGRTKDEKKKWPDKLPSRSSLYPEISIGGHGIGYPFGKAFPPSAEGPLDKDGEGKGHARGGRTRKGNVNIAIHMPQHHQVPPLPPVPPMGGPSPTPPVPMGAPGGLPGANPAAQQALGAIAGGAGPMAAGLGPAAAGRGPFKHGGRTKKASGGPVSHSDDLPPETARYEKGVDWPAIGQTVNRAMSANLSREAHGGRTKHAKGGRTYGKSTGSDIAHWSKYAEANKDLGHATPSMSLPINGKKGGRFADGGRTRKSLGGEVRGGLKHGGEVKRALGGRTKFTGGAETGVGRLEKAHKAR